MSISVFISFSSREDAEKLRARRRFLQALGHLGLLSVIVGLYGPGIGKVMVEQQPEPPAFAEFLLRLCARTKHQQALIGDLNETFNALDRDGVLDLGHVAVGDSFQPDVLGLVAWLCKDQLIAKCEAIIDQAAGSDGLSDDERAARRRATSAKLMVAERLAEAVAWAKLQAGEPVELASDSSAAAILSLEGE